MQNLHLGNIFCANKVLPSRSATVVTDGSTDVEFEEEEDDIGGVVLVEDEERVPSSGDEEDEDSEPEEEEIPWFVPDGYEVRALSCVRVLLYGYMCGIQDVNIDGVVWKIWLYFSLPTLLSVRRTLPHVSTGG